MSDVTIQRQSKGKTKISAGDTVRFMCVTAMLSAIAYIVMFFDFNVHVMPFFIKMDLSDLPALIGSFSMGPVCGVCVCLIKNLLHLTQTSTGGVGELSNFLLGAAFVLPGGLMYRYKKTKKVAIFSAILGAALMGLFSIVSNYFVVYPIYYNFMDKEAIIATYNGILKTLGSSKQIDTILPCLVYFNAPFTFVKGLCSVGVTMLVYKPLSPILKGQKEELRSDKKLVRNGILAIALVVAVIGICVVLHFMQK